MAVGNYTSASGHYVSFAARWHDGRWKLLTMPAVRRQRFADFQGISCPTATRCVAVGIPRTTLAAGTITPSPRLWSGSKWRVSTLRRSPSYFFGVSCPARNRCFASGITFPSLHAFAHPLIETWNGRTWTTQHPARTSAPNTLNYLQHVSCVTQSDCEAVGDSFDPAVSNSHQTLAENWNGHRWTVQTTPNP